MTARASGGLLALVIVTALLPATARAARTSTASPAVPGSIHRYAGGSGEGRATNLAMSPLAVSAGGGRVLSVDGSVGATPLPVLDALFPGVVKSTDPATGIQAIVAGTGAGGFGGDGGPAVAAVFGSPAGIMGDRAGNVFISDTGNQRIRRVDRAGVVTTIAGNGTSGFAGDGGPARDASLYGPGDLAVAPDGAIVFADVFNNRVRRIDPSGRISTIAGSGYPAPGASSFAGDGGPATLAILFRPTSVAFDRLGALYIADSSNNRVRRVGLDGIITTMAGNGSADGSGDGGQASAAGLGLAGSIDFDNDGNLVVLTGNAVRRVDGLGVITTIAGSYASGGFSGDGGPATDATLLNPRSLAVDETGNVYVADSGNQRVRRIANGVIDTIAGNGSARYGGDGDAARSAQLGDLRGIAVRPEGLYVNDAGNDRVRLVDPTGNITTVRQPAHERIAYDRAGNLFTSTDNGTKVVKIAPDGTVTPVVGTTRGFSGDGGPATSAQIDGVSGIAVDGAGNLYFSDLWNARVRRVDPSGVITTFVGGTSTDQSLLTTPNQTRLVLPGDLAIDGEGSLYIAQGWNPVLKVRCGVVTMAYGSPARAVAVDATGAVFVAAEDAVWKEPPAGPPALAVAVAGGGAVEYPDGVPGPAAKLRGPAALALDPSGNLYVGDADRVYRVEGAGAAASVPGVPCARPDHPTFSWGWNGFGALGDSRVAQRGAPDYQNAALADVGTTAIAAGAYHSLALGADGSVWAWGYNGFGGIGDGTTTNRSTPTRVAGLSDVTAITAGAYSSFALKADGTVWAWGWNATGQIGDGTRTDRARPVRVAGLSGVTAISAGYFQVLARTGDGSAWSWGWNANGQLGDGTTTPRMLPQRISSLSGVTAVSGGGYHSLFTRSDGTLWSTGGNWVGQLGDGTTVERHSPVRVSGLTGVTRASAGAFHNLAVVDQVLRAWGWNVFGQLGDGTTIERTTPVLIPSAGVSDISAGAYHSLEIMNGEMFAQGWNGGGQAYSGPGDTTRPEEITGVPGPKAVAAGVLHSLAIWDVAT